MSEESAIFLDLVREALEGDDGVPAEPAQHEEVGLAQEHQQDVSVFRHLLDQEHSEDGDDVVHPAPAHDENA